MEINSQNDISQSQSEKNTHSTQGNSRPENILCKNHETRGDMLKDIINALEKLQEDGSKDDNQNKPVSEEERREIFSKFSRLVNAEREDEINQRKLRKQKEKKSSSESDIESENKDEKDKEKETPRPFAPSNPNLQLDNRNPPYIPPQQPKAINNLEDALSNILQSEQPSTEKENIIEIQLATEEEDIMEVENQNTISYEGKVYEAQTDKDGRKYFHVRYMSNNKEVKTCNVYLVNTYNQYPGWLKRNENDEEYVYSHTTYTIWFSQCRYLIMSFASFRKHCLKYVDKVSSKEKYSEPFLSTYHGLKQIITHPNVFILTQELYNIIFVYASYMYNIFKYYAEPSNYGYDLYVHLSLHPMATREVVENILSIHMNAIFTSWRECVNVYERLNMKTFKHQYLNNFVEVVIGFLQQWTIYLKPKILEEYNVKSYFTGLFLNDSLNDIEQQSKYSANNMFKDYVWNYDQLEDEKQARQRPLKSYLERNDKDKESYDREIRKREVKYDVVWKQMATELQEQIDLLEDEELSEKIKQLDIYEKFTNESMMQIDFGPKEISFEGMTKEQIFQWVIRRHKYSLQKAFIQGTFDYALNHGLPLPNYYYYPTEIFTKEAENIIRRELLAIPRPIKSLPVFYILKNLLDFIDTLPENHILVLFREKNVALKIEEVLNGLKREEEEEEDDYEEEEPQPRTLGATHKGQGQGKGKGKSRGWKVPRH